MYSPQSAQSLFYVKSAHEMGQSVGSDPTLNEPTLGIFYTILNECTRWATKLLVQLAK